jgi:hypothetical protein
MTTGPQLAVTQKKKSASYRDARRRVATCWASCAVLRRLHGGLGQLKVSGPAVSAAERGRPAGCAACGGSRSAWWMLVRKAFFFPSYFD